MYELIIQLPLHDNNGDRFDPYLFERFEQELLKAYGGYTNLGQVKGAWIDPVNGKVYHDTSRLYSVGTTDNYAVTSLDSPILALLNHYNFEFEQEAFCLRFQGQIHIVSMS